jgi:hypothetical protein
VAGCIIGRALYEHRVTLAEALAAARRAAPGELKSQRMDL